MKHEKETDNPSIRIYIKKTENRITFEIKRGSRTFLFLEQGNYLEALKVT